jgi:hypothetical protein
VKGLAEEEGDSVLVGGGDDRRVFAKKTNPAELDKYLRNSFLLFTAPP